MYSKDRHFKVTDSPDIATKETKDKVTVTIKSSTFQSPIKPIMANLAFGLYFQRGLGV